MESYKNIDIQHIELIKYQPLHEPDVFYGRDTLYNFNYLRKKLFQLYYIQFYRLYQLASGCLEII